MINFSIMKLFMFLFLIFTNPFYSVASPPLSTSPPADKCNAEQIEQHLTNLELQVREEVKDLRTELQRKFQYLEWQNKEIQSVAEELRLELRSQEYAPRRYDGRQDASESIENKIDNLAFGMQVLVAAVKIVTADIIQVKNNLTLVVNQTNTTLKRNEKLVTKQIFNDGLAKIKDKQIYPSVTEKQSKYQQNGSPLPKSCRDLQTPEKKFPSGIYRIKPENSPAGFMVFCDMETQGGGWANIHNRYDGMQDFNLNWESYKRGFGNLGGEHWLGLSHVYEMTGHEVNELLIELTDFRNVKAYARYSSFSIGSKDEGFALKILSGYRGNAGDSLVYHAGSRFSTKDVDQDSWEEGSCAQAHGGAWWYRACDESNLNGKYLFGELPEPYMYQGMYWKGFGGPQYSLMQARMMIRPRDHDAVTSGSPGALTESAAEKSINLFSKNWKKP